VVDGNNVTLGSMLSGTSYGLTILTSTGYVLDLAWDLSRYPSQIWYTAASCGTGGSAYLNDGYSGAGGQTMWGKAVVWSGSWNSYMVPESVSGTTGMSTSVAFTAASIDNPTCYAEVGTRSGWKLVKITNAALGLPVTLSTPLKLQ
jgi:hypothetical protein